MTSSHHLEAFLAVMRTGSISEAAKALSLSPSAVSQQIAALEKDLGTALFLRRARSIEPAPGAEATAEQAGRILAQLDALKHQAKHQSSQSHLTIGLYASLAQRIAAALQERLSERGITARYVIADPPMIGHDLLSAQHGASSLDLGIVFHLGAGSPAVTGAFQRDWLEDEPFDVVVPSLWHVPPEATGADLGHLGWIVHHPGTADATIMERALEFDAEPPLITARSDDFRASLELVRAGVGAALVPRSVLAAEDMAGLELRPNTNIRLVRGVFALSHRTSPHAAVVKTALEEIKAILTPQ